MIDIYVLITSYLHIYANLDFSDRCLGIFAIPSGKNTNGPGIECGRPNKNKIVMSMKWDESRDVGKATDDNVEVSGLNIVLFMMI